MLKNGVKLWKSFQKLWIKWGKPVTYVHSPMSYVDDLRGSTVDYGALE